MASRPPATDSRRRKRNRQALDYDWNISPDGVARIMGFILPFVNAEAEAQGGLVFFRQTRREIVPYEAVPGNLELALQRADPKSLLHACLSRWIPAIRAQPGPVNDEGTPEAERQLNWHRNKHLRQVEKREADEVTRADRERRPVPSSIAYRHERWKGYQQRGGFRADVEDKTATLDAAIRSNPAYGDLLANGPHRWTNGMYVPVVHGHLVIANPKANAQIERDDIISEIPT